MRYSTGNSHLLSAILTRASGRSTLELARDWLAPLKDFAIPDWLRGPQAIYLGGNQMAMSPRSLLARSEEHTTDRQSLMRLSYPVLCLNNTRTLASPPIPLAL